MGNGALTQVLGQPLSATVKWATELFKCPELSEENKCVGEFHIYAYLSVFAERVQTSPISATGASTTTTTTHEHKLLPQKFILVFSVDCSETRFSSDEVKFCMWLPEQPAPNPKTIISAQGNYVFSYGNMNMQPDPPDDSGTNLKAKTLFVWNQGPPVIGISGLATLPGPGPISPSSIGFATTASAGPNHPATVGWDLSAFCGYLDLEAEVESETQPSGLYREILRCSKIIRPQPETTDLADAKEVFRRHYIPPP